MTRNEEIREREQATTLGPWVNVNDGYITFGKQKVCVASSSGKNAEFIAHAREDIPWLLDENERLTRGIKDIDKICAERYDEIVRLTAKVEALEAAIKRNRPCWACCRNCDTFDRHECIESGGRFFRFNEASFVGEVSHEH